MIPNVNFDGDKWIKWLYSKSQDKYFNWLIIALVAFGLLLVFAIIDISKISLSEIIVAGIIIITIGIILWSIRRIPKNIKGNIGIAIAINCEDGQDAKKIKSDFINNLGQLLTNDSTRTKFYLVKIPEFHAKRIKNNQDASEMRKRAQCHLIIYGVAKKRELNGKTCHVLRLESEIVHDSINENVQQKFCNEMAELFPRRLHIDTENDLFHFEITAEWINYVTRYFVGIASSVSGYLEYSEKIFYSLYSDGKLRNINSLPLKKMMQRLPIRLGEIYACKASQQFSQWRKDKQNIQIMENVGIYIRKLNRFHPKQYNGMLLAAIYYFVNKRDINKSIRILKNCQGIHDATWRYSLAFLYAYRGEVKKARRIYDQAFRSYCNPESILQTEEFILWVLDKEPDKIQLHYFLGLINWKGKEDLETAKNDFNKFLKDKSASFSDEKRRVSIYIKSIESEMEKTSS